MPGLLHEGLVELLRRAPQIVGDLLSAAGVPVPRFTEARTDSAGLTEVRPAELRADLVVVLEDEGAARLAVVLEVQLAADPDKLYSWPAYQVGARSRYRCAAVVLVLAPLGRVAGWAAQPVELGPGSVFRATVVGPEGLIRVGDPRRAADHVELSLLSALAHGQTESADAVPAAVEDALAVLEACRSLDAGLQVVYSDLLVGSVSQAVREAIMTVPAGYQFRTELAIVNQAKGKAEAVLEALEVRGLAVTDEQRARVLACTDIDQLRAWHRRAVTVARTEDVFDD